MSARHRLIAGVMLAFAALPARALDIQTPPAPEGMELWLVEDHTLPMIAMTASFPAGSAYDPQGKGGLAAFAAGLIDEGAGEYDATAFTEALDERGIRFSASPDREHLIVSLQTLTEEAGAAFRLLGIALSQPRFAPDAVERVRAQLLAVLKRNEEDPAQVASEAWSRIYFGDHPYGRPVSGTKEEVRAITQADLKAFAARHWVRGAAQIAVAGDVTAERLAKLLDSAFGALPLREVPALPPPERTGAPGTHHVTRDIGQATAIFGAPGILRHDPDFIPAYVANYVLGGGGFSSRLMDEVREKRGLAYGVSTGLVTLSKAGIFAGQVATEASRIGESLDLIRSELRRFAEDGVTGDELDDAKTYLTGAFPLAFDSNGKIAGQLNAFQRDGLAPGYIDERQALIEAVTEEDVQRAARRLFAPEALTIVIAGPEEKPSTAAAP